MTQSLMRGSEMMSQDHSIHPLDQDEESRDYRVYASNSQTSLWVLGIFGGVFGLITFCGAALINSNPSTSFPRLGQLLWQIGGYGMLACCFLTLFVIRRKKIQSFLSKAINQRAWLESSWITLVIRSLGGFLVVATILALVHLTLGSYRSFNIYFRFLPVLTAMVLALIGATSRESRAFWIGFATAMFMGGLGNDFDQYLRFMASGGNPITTVPRISGSPAMLGRLSGIRQIPGYSFEYGLLLAQIASFGWAIFSGLMCSFAVKFSLSLSALTQKENGIISKSVNS